MDRAVVRSPEEVIAEKLRTWLTEVGITEGQCDVMAGGIAHALRKEGFYFGR